MKTLVVCSGGLDSVTLAYQVASEHELAGLLSFNYGQRHMKELACAARISEHLGVTHTVIDISSVGAHLSGSALTSNIDVPDGHYAEESMKITVVPNRNAIMLSIAYGIAADRKLNAVACAFHAGDHFIYSDCRPEFVHRFADMQTFALKGVADVQLYTPFLEKMKKDIVIAGAKYGVPFGETWSCYKGDDLHCGRCGTCVERQEAFDLAGIQDPTHYADSDFWRGAVCDKEIA